MVNQGARRIGVAELRRRNEALLAELATQARVERDLREQLKEVKEPKGWRSWRWVGQLPAILTALTAAAALFYTAAGLSQSRAATTEQNRLAQSGQITDRFNAAVTNLGSGVMTIRLGGIYALQRIMHDSFPDQATVCDILTAFIRAQAPMVPNNARRAGPPAIDVQAALTVLADRNIGFLGLEQAGWGETVYLSQNMDLSNTDLAQMNLVVAALRGANLSGADLSGANISFADLAATSLKGADLAGADLSGTKLQGADLAGADLTGTKLQRADLTGASLTGTMMCNGSTPLDPSRGYRCSP